MSIPLRLAIAFAVVATSACSPQTQTAASNPEDAALPAAVAAEDPAAPLPPPVEVASSKLEQLFHPDMLDVDVAYFEQTAGIARKSDGDRREYRVEGCDVAVNLMGGQVRNMRLQLADSCHVDLNRFLREYGIPKTEQLTFGNFIEAAGTNFTWYADCLVACGNAYDPSVYLEWTAPRSNLFYTVVLEGRILGGTELVEKMKQDKGEVWVVDARFNCEEEARPFKDLWTTTYANEKPHAVTIGWDVAVSECPAS